MEEKKTEVVDEVRENFTLKTLQERVWRLESENKELKVNNTILQTQYTSQCETQSDILRTLHANLDENYSKIEESELRIQRLEQMLEDQKQEFKDKLEEERAQWEHRVAGLQMKNDSLEDKLEKVAEFQRNKDSMEGELAKLKQDLQEEKERHAKEISAHDRKKAVEIDQLKQDMQRTVKETRELLKARTKDQLDATTKRTIMENAQFVTELHFQSKETERLLEKNQALQEENAQLKRNLVIHKDLENELARRTHVYQKLIKKLERKGATDVASVSIDQPRDLKQSIEIMQEQSVGPPMKSELASTTIGEESSAMKRQVEAAESALQMVRHEFAQYRRDHATLTQLQDQSTRLIIAALYELKNQRECDPFPPASYDEHAQWQFVQMTPKQKEYFFRVLLEKLNSSMCISCFPTGCQSSHHHHSSTALPAISLKASQREEPRDSKWGSTVSLEVVTQGTQTDTDSSDPCLKQGFWSPDARTKYTGTVTPSLVKGAVRPWGTSTLSRRPVSLSRHGV